MICDFHTHLGDIWPKYRKVSLSKPSPTPHYLMISSDAIVAPDQLFYRTRPKLFSLAFVKHVAITVFQRRKTIRGMVIPNLLRDMRTHGVTASVVLPIEYNDGIERSATLIRECQNFPNLIPFCSVHPRDPLGIKKMHKYLQMGAKGLKLHPNFQRIAPDDNAVQALCSEYSRYQRPLLLHSGTTGRERHRTAFSSLDEFKLLPKQFPEMPIILAHAGISQYHDAIGLAQQHGNIYLELSGQPAQHIQQALTVLGSERLLFGSDWPFWNQSFALQAVRKVVQGDPIAEERILYKNAEQLLGSIGKKESADLL